MRLLNLMADYFEGVPDALRKRKLLVWLFFVVATAFMIAGFGRAKFDTSIEGWFDREDPTIVAFDWFHHEFGSDDHLYIVYKPKDGDVFSQASLKTLQALQRDILDRAGRAPETSPLKHVVKITSLINAPVLRAEGDVLYSRKLVGDTVPSDAGSREELRRIAQSQKAFPLLYFSKDYRYGGMLIETDFGAIPLDAPVAGAGAAAQKPDAEIDFGDVRLDEPVTQGYAGDRPRFKPTDLADYVALMNEIKAVMNKPEYAGQFQYYPVGATALAEHNLAMITEMGLLNLAALLVIVAMLWFLFRSLSAVVWSVTIVLLSVIWTVGIISWVGLPITSFVMISTMLTLAIGVADAVHVMSDYMSTRSEGSDHASAMRHVFRHVAAACLLTTVTNVVAVLALSITPIVPIQVFAVMCSLGVALPLLFTIYLLPVMLDLWAPQGTANAAQRGFSARVARWIPNVNRWLARKLDGVLPLVQKNPVAIICVFGLMFAACVYGATQTRVDTDPVGSFPKDSSIRESVRVVDGNMMGAQSMEIFIDLGQENAFLDPAVLHEIEKLQDKIERDHPELVVRTTSLVETVKKSYKTLNADREDRYVIPANRDAVSQTLFLFNQSNPDDRRKLVSDNYDKSHISVRLYNHGSYEYIQAWGEMQADIDRTVQTLRRTYPDAKVSITGSLALMMQGADYLSRSELQSFALALVLVSVIFLLIFGTVKAGLIALVPNLIPAMLGFGGLGLMGIPMDITTMMIAPVIIGIAVDDTVHFITRYRFEVERDGDIERALRDTISGAGQPVVFATLILGLGFGIMGLSSNAGTANLGIFGFLAIAIGLLNDLFLLPALILTFKLRFARKVAPQPAFA